MPKTLFKKIGEELTERVKIPNPLAPVRKDLDDLRQELYQSGAILQPTALLKFIEQVSAEQTNLADPAMADSAKNQAIADAQKTIAEIRKAMAPEKAKRGDAAAKIAAIHGRDEKEFFGPWAEKLREVDVYASTVKEYAAFEGLYAKAVADISASPDKTTADTLASKYEADEKACRAAAETEKAEFDKQIPALKASNELTKAFNAILLSIPKKLDELDVRTGTRVDPNSPLRVELAQLRAKTIPGQGDLEEARKLETKVDDALKASLVRAEDKLKPLRQFYKLLKDQYETLKKTKVFTPATAIDKIELPYLGLKNYYKLIDAKCAQIDRCFDGKMPESGQDLVTSLLEEFKGMLEEVEKFSDKDEEELQAEMSKIKKLSASSSMILFDTKMQTYVPRDVATLKTQYDSCEKNCANMKPAETLAYLQKLGTVADAAKRRADDLEKLCKKAKTKIDESNSVLFEISDQFKKIKGSIDAVKLTDDEMDDAGLTQEDLDAAKAARANGVGGDYFQGDFRKTLDQLKAAYNFPKDKGPDGPEITRLMQAYDDELKKLKPNGAFDPDEFKKSHVIGQAKSVKEMNIKETMDKLESQIRGALVVAQKAVDAADPGDESQMAAIKSLFKTTKKAAKDLAPEAVIKEYRKILLRLEILTKNPQGEAATARGNLEKIGAEYKSAAAEADQDIKDLQDFVRTAYPKTKPNRAELIKLIEASGSEIRFPSVRLVKALDDFKNNKSQPDLLKSREAALSGIRAHLALVDGDPVVSKLLAEGVFPNGGVQKLRAKLKDLELNLRRGI